MIKTVAVKSVNNVVKEKRQSNNSKSKSDSDLKKAKELRKKQKNWVVNVRKYINLHQI